MTENLNAVRSIRTRSGKYVNVFETDPDTIDIKDIAHALSQQCRFGGHLPKFYSVAQHSLMCYENVPDEFKLDALMHDASEAYLLDFPSPIKVEMTQYKEIEHKLMLVIADKYGFNYPKSPAIDKVDQLMLEWEWNALMLRKPNETFSKIKCLTPAQAKKAFLTAFNAEIEKRKVEFFLNR